MIQVSNAGNLDHNAQPIIIKYHLNL